MSDEKKFNIYYLSKIIYVNQHKLRAFLFENNVKIEPHKDEKVSKKILQLAINGIKCDFEIKKPKKYIDFYNFHTISDLKFILEYSRLSKIGSVTFTSLKTDVVEKIKNNTSLILAHISNDFKIQNKEYVIKELLSKYNEYSNLEQKKVTHKKVKHVKNENKVKYYPGKEFYDSTTSSIFPKLLPFGGKVKK
jgi:hypothetical protein